MSPSRETPKGRFGPLRPLALAGTPEGAVFAILCVVAIVLMYVVDVTTPAALTIGNLVVLPVLAAAWLLSRRLTIALAALAVGLRGLAVSVGALHFATGTAQAVGVVLFALFGRLAAEQFARTERSISRSALASRLAHISTSSDKLNVILYGVLDELARSGYPGGLVALMDERNELYPTAVEGAVDRGEIEQRLLSVSGVMDRAAKEARSVLISDLRDSAPDSTPPASVRSVVAVPLRGGGTTLGVLEVDSEQAGRFDPEDCLVLEQAALAVSSAVQRAGSLQLADEQMRRRLKDLGLLLQTARTLSSSLDLEHIVTAVVQSSGALMTNTGRHGVRASLFRVEGNNATFLAEYDEDGVKLRNERFPVRQHLGLARAIDSGRAASWDFDTDEEPLAALIRRTGVKSGAFAPVRTGNQLFGVLSAASRDEYEFDAEELRLLEGIADLAGLAISNSQRLDVEMSRSEQLREHADRMQALEKTKSEFLRLASHELRGPIAILRGYISMLNEGTLGELPEQARRVMPLLTEKSTEMNHLIDQMLETARLEDTRLQLNLELVDLGQLLLDSVQGLEGKAQSSGSTLVTDIKAGSSSNGSSAELGAHGARVSVLADRDRLGTILVNLIDNAIKYSPDGGEVRCTLSVAENRARVTVADQGLGIDAGDLRRLFTRFGRIVTPENSHIPGTGLGLYLSRELARMHGGDITVESEKGNGSVFTLTLPVAVERLHRLAEGHLPSPSDFAGGGEPNLIER